MIKATIILDSINTDGVQITTFELEYPRFIHSELMTHRMFSRNAASSRAIPVETMLSFIESTPAMPVSWGKNAPGMQAHEELPPIATELAKQAWMKACAEAVRQARIVAKLGAHKQIVNRLVEPFATMKTIVTSTEMENWYNLRYHKDADPTIYALAAAMAEAECCSASTPLAEGQWHLPYVESYIDEAGQQWFTQDGVVLDLETARKISVSCCAQVSYRKNDTSLEKAETIYQRLIGGNPWHASPFEHQAMAIETPRGVIPKVWPKGVTHIDKDLGMWSGNFLGWVQYRQLL